MSISYLLIFKVRLLCDFIWDLVWFLGEGVLVNVGLRLGV